MRMLSVFALCLAVIFLPMWLLATQVEDNPDYIHVRTGHFATPLELAGDVNGRRITSIVIECELTGKERSPGLFSIDCTPLEFNEFGDASRVGDNDI